MSNLLSLSYFYGFVLLALVVSLFYGCGKKESSDPAAPLADSELSAKVDDYTLWMATVEDEHGAIYTDECDSLLFSALVGIHSDLDIRAFREENGRWHRTPAKTCYSNWLANEERANDPDWTKLEPSSKSTISRDMLLGVMWYAWYRQDLELADRLWSYGSSRSWIMGDGLRNRTLLTPAFVGTLAQLVYKLGGKDHLERQILVDWPAGSRDFESHLETLHILLRQRLYGTMEETAQKRLQDNVERNPLNPLFQYAVGNSSEAASLLKDEIYYPRERLPTSDDRCGRWLLEREMGSNWLPCDEKKTHSGGEVIFLGHLILNG